MRQSHERPTWLNHVLGTLQVLLLTTVVAAMIYMATHTDRAWWQGL